MVPRSDPNRTCKTSRAGVVSLFLSLVMIRTAQDAPVLYGEFAWQSSLYETDDMPCEFGILVRWGEVCWYWFVGFRFLWMWWQNKLRRFMWGAAFRAHDMVPIGQGLKSLDLYSCFFSRWKIALHLKLPFLIQSFFVELDLSVVEWSERGWAWLGQV